MAFQVSRDQLAGGDTLNGIPAFGFQKMDIVVAGDTHTCHVIALAFFAVLFVSGAASLCVLGGYPIQTAYLIPGVLCALAALGCVGSAVYLMTCSLQKQQLMKENLSDQKKKVISLDEMLRAMKLPVTQTQQIRGALMTFSTQQRSEFTQTIYQNYEANQAPDDLKILIACAAFPENFESLPFLEKPRDFVFVLLENFEKNGVTEEFLTKIGNTVGLPTTEAECLIMARYPYFRTKDEKMAYALLSYLPEDWPDHEAELKEMFDMISAGNQDVKNRHPMTYLLHSLR
jgi:hypothetical protein